MNILLTDEEIEQARQEGIRENFIDISRGVIQQGQDYDWYQRRAIAEAQLKKVVELLEPNSKYTKAMIWAAPSLENTVHYIIGTLRQALLKEIE